MDLNGGFSRKVVYLTLLQSVGLKKKKIQYVGHKIYYMVYDIMHYSLTSKST